VRTIQFNIWFDVLLQNDDVTLRQELLPADVVAVHLSTAHPHVDDTGNIYNLGTAINPNPRSYNIVRIPPAKDKGTQPAFSRPAPHNNFTKTYEVGDKFPFVCGFRNT
jgi:hypothetical protein